MDEGVFMKQKFKRILLLPMSLFLAGCFGEKDPSKNSIKINEKIIEIEHDYSEVFEYQILWENVFKIDKENYLVYFYSTTCSNCSEIKNFIIEKTLERKDIFLVKSSNLDRIEKDVQNTIGVGKIGDFAILGYPSLVEIDHGICVKNMAGKTQILSFLK